MSARRLLLLLSLGAAMTAAPAAYASPHHAGDSGPAKQRCTHNGVHANPAGHPSCGLHRGRSGDSTGDSGGDTGGAV
ncbi:MAG TPA: hypothetical protein VGJ11_07770 [Gaiellales bacterium]|jgi:hypothetical protein